LLAWVSPSGKGRTKVMPRRIVQGRQNEIAGDIHNREDDVSEQNVDFIENDEGEIAQELQKAFEGSEDVFNKLPPIALEYMKQQARRAKELEESSKGKT